MLLTSMLPRQQPGSQHGPGAVDAQNILRLRSIRRGVPPLRRMAVAPRSLFSATCLGAQACPSPSSAPWSALDRRTGDWRRAGMAELCALARDGRDRDNSHRDPPAMDLESTYGQEALSTYVSGSY